MIALCLLGETVKIKTSAVFYVLRVSDERECVFPSEKDLDLTVNQRASRRVSLQHHCRLGIESAQVEQVASGDWCSRSVSVRAACP